MVFNRKGNFFLNLDEKAPEKPATVAPVTAPKTADAKAADTKLAVPVASPAISHGAHRAIHRDTATCGDSAGETPAATQSGEELATAGRELATADRYWGGDANRGTVAELARGIVAPAVRRPTCGEATRM